MTRGLFLGFRRDRLGARLLVLLNCMRLAEDFGAAFGLDWFPTGADATYLDDPKELFAEHWADAHLLDGDVLASAYDTGKPLWSFQSDAGPDALTSHLGQGGTIIVEEGFEPFVFPWEDRAAILPRFETLLDRVDFADPLPKKMGDVRAALRGGDATAYHLRRGDILNGLPWKHSTWPAKIEADELYHAHIATAPDAPSLIFSDTPEAIARMKARYPQLRTVEDVTSVDGLTPSQRDFIELYAMSRAERIVAPIISAFSTAAARLSGRERLMFRDVLPGDAISAASDALRERLKADEDSFLSLSEATHLYSKLHQDLTAEDGLNDACDIAERLLAQGADNAFLPILQTLNYLYLGRLEEADGLARRGLADANLWPSDYAVLSAVHAAVLGAMGRKRQAGRAFTRAFWAKPTRPDVAVVGSRLLYRNQIPLAMLPPFDVDLQKAIVREWYPPFNNLYLVQWRIVRKKPTNFDALLIDWSDLALDQKARRITSDRERLTALKADLEFAKGVAPDAPERIALEAMIDFRLGQNIGSCRRRLDTALGAQPTNPLYHTRMSAMLEAEGDDVGARTSLTDALSLRPANPFIIFKLAALMERQGEDDHALALYVDAARRDTDSAAIQGRAGQVLMKAGRPEEALPLIEAASRLCPSYQRFENQAERLRSKLGVPERRSQAAAEMSGG